MSNSIKFDVEEVRSLGFASTGAAYMGIGTSFASPIRIIEIENLTNGTMMFSFDGVKDHFPLPGFSSLFLDIAKNGCVEDGFFLGAEERIYVKRIGIPTLGSVYVSAFKGTSD